MAKNKKKNNNIFSTALYYLNPANLSAEIKSYGYALSPVKLIIYYIATIAGCIGVGYLFELTKIAIGVIVAVGIFFTPLVFRNLYKNKYEQQRFSDITLYMEKILYAFKGSHKILTSLSEVQHSFVQGPMYDTIGKAIEYILSSPEKDAEKEGLRIIEKEYSNDRLRTIHRFLLKVEGLGGNFDKTIDVLLEDRTMWVDRQGVLQKDKKRKLIEVIMAVGVTLGMCWFILTGLPDNIEISSGIVYQIISTIVIIMDIIICVIGYSSISADYLQNKNKYSHEKVQKDYEFVKNFDKVKAYKMSIPMFIIPIGSLIYGIMTSKVVFMALAAIFTVMILSKPTMSYDAARKRLKREANIKFPRWLMEIALQLQSTSVNKAILNSIAGAPTVLKPELLIFEKEEAAKPYSIEPYLNFMKDFEIPEISSSMSMLYSISSGTGGDAETQINDIIKRNNIMLDKAEALEDENKLAGLHSLMLFAEVSGGLKMLVDMILFMVAFMQMSTI